MIQVHRDLDNLPAFKNAVLTIGTFDGVHVGHQKIIDQLKEEALLINGETVIITFHPHPRKVVKHKTEIRILNSLDEKIELLNNQGLHHLVVVPFTEAFSNLTAEAYIDNFLVSKFSPKTIIIGYDHKFGKDRKGDYHLLEDMANKYKYHVKEIPEHVINQITISSTKIREALLHNDLHTANKYLGYSYFFEGLVIEGNKLGRSIGYPTANLFIENEEKLIPGNGVYAVEVVVGNDTRTGMMNIGIRPTINGISRTIEINVFDFDKDIYGNKMRVYLKHFLRAEEKFSGIDELKNQLAQDKLNALSKLSS
ncbi:MAG: bifunctional riboflavin kinase/FAD synthetase [Segetibacter sp.]|nr:bifunctional riboflavin kinase/FAD synthetase [Segetibacter sp.]